MISKRAQENIVALLILGIFIATIIAASQYGPRARLVPIPIAVIGILLILGQLFLQNFRSDKDLEIDLLEMISRKATGDHDDPAALARVAESAKVASRLDWQRELTAIGLVLLPAVLFFLIGPLPTMFLFTAGYFILSRFASPAMSVLYALIATVAVYLLFVAWLGVDMRQGLFDLSFGLW